MCNLESEDEKIHCFQKEGTLSNGREEFTERAVAFYAVLGQGAPIDENDPFTDLEPDIFEESNEVVVHEDKPISHKHYCEHLLIQTKRTLATLPYFNFNRFVLFALFYFTNKRRTQIKCRLQINAGCLRPSFK